VDFKKMQPEFGMGKPQPAPATALFLKPYIFASLPNTARKHKNETKKTA
jgi:hypothetical protein